MASTSRPASAADLQLRVLGQLERFVEHDAAVLYMGFEWLHRGQFSTSGLRRLVESTAPSGLASRLGPFVQTAAQG